MNDPVVVIAAHPDDEVLGCGGTLARMAAEGRPVYILLIADGETSRLEGTSSAVALSKQRLRGSAAEDACGILGCASVEALGLPDNRLDGMELLDLVKRIETFIERHKPRTVFTHHASDVNMDHRVVHDAVVAACRPQPGHPVNELLFFEVPSSTEWQVPGSTEPFTPNWFLDVSATLETKLKALQAYRAELREFPHPRSLRAVEALARWRGATAGVEAAEAFVLGRKIIK